MQQGTDNVEWVINIRIVLWGAVCVIYISRALYRYHTSWYGYNGHDIHTMTMVWTSWPLYAYHDHYTHIMPLYTYHDHYMHIMTIIRMHIMTIIIMHIMTIICISWPLYAYHDHYMHIMAIICISWLLYAYHDHYMHIMTIICDLWVKLLIKHEAKLSALSRTECHKSHEALLAHFKWYRVTCVGRRLAFSLRFLLCRLQAIFGGPLCHLLSNWLISFKLATHSDRRWKGEATVAVAAYILQTW